MRRVHRADGVGAGARVVRAAALLAVAAIAACASSSDGKAPGHIVRLLSELRKPYISMRAADAPEGSEFDRVPLDLWGPFRWEATFGAFDAGRKAGLENTFFGTELNSRGAAGHYYFGVYGHVEPGGISTSVEIEDASGYAFLPGPYYADVDVVEAAIEHDGAHLRFLVRPRGSEQEYDEIGRIPFSPQPYPLNPGIGTFNFTGDAEVGFDRLRVVSNSPAPEAVDEAHAAFDTVFAAFSPLAEARYALTEPVPDTAAAAAHLADFAPRLDAANAAVASLSKTTTPRKKSRASRRALRRARAKAARSRNLLLRRGAAVAPRVLKEIAGHSYSLVQACDAILPPHLRDAIPGDHKSLR